jgi:hypothetical protein
MTTGSIQNSPLRLDTIERPFYIGTIHITQHSPGAPAARTSVRSDDSRFGDPRAVTRVHSLVVSAGTLFLEPSAQEVPTTP